MNVVSRARRHRDPDSSSTTYNISDVVSCVWREKVD
jgi:hypothetical protein